MDDVSEFAKKLKELTENEGLRKRLGGNALKVIQKYDWRHVIRMYRELYENV
jgi:glycosyltransferase involved in cell wall biosynthesis